MKRLKHTLPEPPLMVQDEPGDLPVITQYELTVFANAHNRYLIARADFEEKRAGLFKKVLFCCDVEPGSQSVRLGEEGKLVLDEEGNEGGERIVA